MFAISLEVLRSLKKTLKKFPRLGETLIKNKSNISKIIHFRKGSRVLIKKIKIEEIRKLSTRNPVNETLSSRITPLSREIGTSCIINNYYVDRICTRRFTLRLVYDGSRSREVDFVK